MLQVNSLHFNYSPFFIPVKYPRGFSNQYTGLHNHILVPKTENISFFIIHYSWRLCFFNSILSKVCFQVTKDILTILNFVRKWKTYSLQLFYSIDDHQHLTCWAGNSMSKRSLNKPFNIDWSLSKDKLLFRLPWVLE